MIKQDPPAEPPRYILPPQLKRIDIVTATVPPYVCGIGDYTARLAQVLKPFASIRLLSGQTTFDPSPDITTETVFTRDDKNSIWNVAEYVKASPPDWLVIQYAPDTLVNRGLTPLAPLLKKIRREHPAVKVAVMVHEWNNPVTDLKSSLKNAFLRSQLRAIGRNADHMLFSVEAWVDQTRHWFPQALCSFMPVGSAMPLIKSTCAEAKKRLGIDRDTFVIGLFGRLNETCDINWCVRSIEAIAKVKAKVAVLYIGIYGALLKERLQNRITLIEGAVPPEEVSLRMAAMDLFLLPDREGASARRTRLMTSLQHGVATLTTQSSTTDAILIQAEGRAISMVSSNDGDSFVERAVLLAEQDDLRQNLEQQAQTYFGNNFSWEHIRNLWLKTLMIEMT